MASDVLVAVYETADQAAEVVRELEGAGIPSSAIHQLDQRHSAWDGDQPRETGRVAERGFWASLFGTDEGSERDHYVYDDSVRRGGTVVSVTADSAQHDRVIAVLERYNPLDLDDRGRQSEFGATDTTTSATGNDVGSTTSAYGTTTAAYGTTADRERDLAAGSAATGAMAGRAEPDLTANRDVASERSEGERVIQLAEEQLQVGKRVVETGRTRIRRYVVETPVEERIRLRTERVVIERRRPVSGSGLSPDAFTETTTDVVERSEQPIVSKTARIGEEVVVRTDADEREETVRDTVRREDVEVTQAGTETNVTGRTAGTRPATPTTTAGTTGTTGTGRT